jgi:hypothetical protein
MEQPSGLRHFRQGIDSRSGLAERLNLPRLKGKGLKGKEGDGVAWIKVGKEVRVKPTR